MISFTYDHIAAVTIDQFQSLKYIIIDIVLKFQKIIIIFVAIVFHNVV